MKSIKLTYIIFAFLIVIAGCRKDEKVDRQVIKDPTGNPTIEVVSGVTGLVTDEDNNPISNATVSVYNKEVTTDENGIFYINNEGLREVKSTVHVQQAEYFDGFKTFIPAVGQKSFVQLRMVRKGSPKSILSTEGGSIDINDGAELTLPANGVKVKNGGANYSGEVNIYAHWYNPSDPDLGLTMPGNLSGITSEGNEVQLGTYGMMAVELESPEGIPLQLADNAKATLRFPLSDILDPPETIPLWSFDESDGVWMQENEANLLEGFYIAEVSHFSFWNCDAPFPLVNIEGRILNKGEPVANYNISITTENLVSAYGTTDSEGYFRGKVPKGEFLVMHSTLCGQKIIAHEFGIFEEDAQLGNIEIDVSNFISVLKGRMIGCEGEALQSAYGILKSGNEVTQVITSIANGTDEDGNFSTIFTGCQFGNYSVQFFNPENNKSTDVFDLNTTEDVINLEDVMICDDEEEFISYTVNGEQVPFITESDVYFSNDEKIIIRGGLDGANSSFAIDVFASTMGNYNPSSVSIQRFGGTSDPRFYMMCGDHINNVFPCNEFNIRITSFGEYIVGTFDGALVSYQDSLAIDDSFANYSIEGSFKVKVDEKITTGEISGNFWIDEIPNNIRDGDETKSMRVQHVRLKEVTGNQETLFPTFLQSTNNIYKFTDLRPGTYYIEVDNDNEYEVVIQGVGSEDRDCDFGAEGDDIDSEELTINENEIFQNIDLGYLTPDHVSLINFNYFGCAPDITIVASVNGGLPPYTFNLNEELFVETNNYVSFNIIEGGSFTLEVIDNIGNLDSINPFINSYSNGIRGRVWRDIDGGASGSYDGNDESLNDITVRLLNENGELVDDTLSIDGEYAFTNVAPGIYFIEIVEFGSLEILIQNTEIGNGNDINPETGRSDVFTIGPCNFQVRIDAGLM